MAHILILAALSEEADALFSGLGDAGEGAVPHRRLSAHGHEVAIATCGLGKVNAAHVLTRRLSDYRHAERPLPRVINFGTAGSQRHPAGSLVECRALLQRDMDVTGLGVPAGVTPFEDIPARLEFPTVFPRLTQGSCASGDSFVMAGCAPDCDVVDMEAYALAKVCWIERTAFVAVKYVSDGIASAMAQAKTAAGDRDVLVLGAYTAQRALEAGVLDELQIHQIPVLFGRGRRMFEVLPSRVELEIVRVIDTPEATHIRYRVRR